MGLTNWKNSPDGLIYKYDVIIAKNYLNEEEMNKKWDYEISIATKKENWIIWKEQNIKKYKQCKIIP